MARTFRNTRLLGVVSAIVAGTSAVTGSAWLYYNKNSLLQAAEQRSESKLSPLESVLASWTTNFKPTVEWDNNWDRRAPTSVVKPSKLDKDEKDHQNELQKVTPTATRHLILIRHGQYNMDGDGDPQRYLTPLGREQAAFTGQRLHALNAQLCKKKGADIKYTKIINSTLTRAIETADIIAACFPQVARQSCDLLCEGAPIPPEPPIGHWRPEPDQFFQDGARIEAAFRRYFHRASPKQEEDSYEIIVCHANVIRYFVCRALQLPPEAWLRMALHHGSITWFAIRPSGRVSLRAVGDAGFIPADKLSFN